MMARTHQLGGAALWLGGCVVLPVSPLLALVGVPVAAYVSLWPDIENEQSTAARWLGPITYRLALRLRRRYGHRYAVHSLLAGVPVCALLATLGGLVLAALVVAATDVTTALLWPLVGMAALSSLAGASSHSLLDSFTCDCAYCHDHAGLYDRMMATLKRWFSYALGLLGVVELVDEFRPFAVRRHVNKAGKPAPGCAWLWPVVKRRIGVPIMIVGGPGESLVVRPLLMGLSVVAGVVTVMGW